MDFEQLLDFVGGAGRYQLIAYVLVGLSVMPTGMHNLANVFLTGLSDFRCKPITTNITANHSDVIDNLLSDWSSERESLGTCKVFDIDYSNRSHLDGFNHTNHGDVDTRSCQQWSYDMSVYGETITTEWDLVCSDAYRRSLAQSLYMFGFLLGAIIFGSIADRLGRKKAWGLAMLLLIVFGTASAFVPNYWSHVILRFVSAMASAGLFTSGFVLGTEMISMRRRLGPAVMYQIWFCIGYMCITVAVAYLARDYVITQLTLSLLVCFSLITYKFVDESPRWLLTQNRLDEACDVLYKISKRNRTGRDRDVIKKAAEGVLMDNDGGERSYTVFDLLKTPNMRKKTLNLWFQWFITSMVYYGLSMGSSDLAGSPYLNLFISGAMEVPGLLLAYIVAQKCGRRIAMFLFLGGGGAACLIILAIPSSVWWLTSILSNVGKMGVSGAFGVVYVFSAEISPTVVRTVGVGSGSMSARVGSLLAPFVGELGLHVWQPLPILIFGSTSILAGALALLVPETLNQKLPDTMEEGETFGKNNKLLSCCCRRKNKLDSEPENIEPLNRASAGDKKAVNVL